MDELQIDKGVIKNILFTKAIPNYVIPVPTSGYKVYHCIDCGDRFLFESSYNHHVSRTSVKICYMCRHCGKAKVFKNRCNFLSHIRSHAFKTATISIKDLKIQPFQMADFKFETLTSAEISAIVKRKLKPPDTGAGPRKSHLRSFCTDCNKDITVSGIVYKDRARHYSQYTNKTFSCPICLFTVSTACALKAHLRVHLKTPPYFCCECGIGLTKNVAYPYNHDCEGFRMMRATARLRCFFKNCAFHPNKLIQHMKENHLTKVFKCTECVIASYDEAITRKHFVETHQDTQFYGSGIAVLYQCKSCQSRLVDTEKKIIAHYESHLINSGSQKNIKQKQIYPCWKCGLSFSEPMDLLNHHNDKHDFPFRLKAIHSLRKNNQMVSTKTDSVYQVVKKCDKCLSQFTYRCKYDEINRLPNECPYHCSSSLKDSIRLTDHEIVNKIIKCPLCNNSTSCEWEDIKLHFSLLHSNIKCLDIEIKLEKINVTKYISSAILSKNNRKRRHSNIHTSAKSTHTADTSLPAKRLVLNNNEVICNICSVLLENKDMLENHLMQHRDPCMAYQCMECGGCFAGKPSFSTHLLLEHGISDIESYIDAKQCFNKDALLVNQTVDSNDEPLAENQCNICRLQFENSENLEKHYRIHGMAFLMSNKIIKK